MLSDPVCDARLSNDYCVSFIISLSPWSEIGLNLTWSPISKSVGELSRGRNSFKGVRPMIRHPPGDGIE